MELPKNYYIDLNNLTAEERGIIMEHFERIKKTLNNVYNFSFSCQKDPNYKGSVYFNSENKKIKMSIKEPSVLKIELHPERELLKILRMANNSIIKTTKI